MPQLTEEEKEILYRAHEIRERIRAEELEAGEITLEEAVASAKEEMEPLQESVRRPTRRAEEDTEADFRAESVIDRELSLRAGQEKRKKYRIRKQAGQDGKDGPERFFGVQAENRSDSGKEDDAPEVWRRPPEDAGNGRPERSESEKDSSGNAESERKRSQSAEPEREHPRAEETERGRLRNTEPERDYSGREASERNRFGRDLSSRDRTEMPEELPDRSGRKQKRRREAVLDRDREEIPQEGGRGKRGKKKKKSLFRRILKAVFVLLLILVLIIGGLFAAFRILVSKTNYQPYETSYVRAGDVYTEKGVTNILLIGTDNRVHQDDTSRSDAMIVFSLNPKKGKIVMSSILRDSYVNIPGVGQNRINHAYQVGGPALLVQTVEENFKIGIDYYMQVDFYNFIDVIDAFGGVYLDVTDATLMNYVNGYVSELNHVEGKEEGYSFLNQPGYQLLNGRQALGYSRIRAVGTDFGRTERQRTVLEALMRQVKAKPFKIFEAVNTVLPNLTTNIDDNRMFLLGLEMAPLLVMNNLVQFQVPAEHYWQNAYMPNGQEVLAIDFEHNNIELRRAIYD